MKVVKLIGKSGGSDVFMSHTHRSLNTEHSSR